MTKSPQTNHFQESLKYEKISKRLVYILFIGTIGINFLGKNVYLEAGTILVYVSSVYFAKQSQNFRYEAESIRRMDFIDNSFGTKYIEDSSENYYDNSEIDHGLYKMIVNVFENALFSTKISERMHNKSKTKNWIAIVIMISFALFGFSKNIYISPCVQLLLSGYFILEYFDIKEYKERTNQIYLDIKKLFDKGLKNEITSIDANIAEIVRIYVLYESNIADKKLLLDSKIYNELNPELTLKWETIKQKYNISEKK